MRTVSLNAALKEEYSRLFGSCEISPRKSDVVERQVDAICKQRARYQVVGERLGIPWQFIGVIHALEADLDFKCHLHNGDPLTARTIQVPAGRPRAGSPPFSWEESAEDALLIKKLDSWKDWSVPGTCYQLERYNGWGYRQYHPEVLSPYLWSCSCHYRCGKYVADGRWSSSAVSKQIGAAVLLRRMLQRGLCSFGDQPPVTPTPPEPVPQRPLVSRYTDRRLRDPQEIAAARHLQNWLNTFQCISLRVDGLPGEKTSEAYRIVTGNYLPDDPRAAAAVASLPQSSLPGSPKRKRAALRVV